MPKRRRKDRPYEEQVAAGYLRGAEHIGRYVSLTAKQVYTRRAKYFPSIHYMGDELFAAVDELDRDMRELPQLKVEFGRLWRQLSAEERAEILVMYE